MEKENLITFIIPAYNSEKWLEDCLDSVVHQTIINHEIIVVDDGSTDRTAEIGDRYVEEYPELIRCIHQCNCGQGSARNNALAEVTTPFVTFLDSDDWQDRLFVERVEHALEMYDELPDIIFTLPWIYDYVSKRVTEWYDKKSLEDIFFPGCNPDETVSVMTNARKDPRIYQLEANTNRRVYRTAFLKSINFSFSEGVKWEDVYPHFYAVHKANRCIALRNTGFFYRINTGAQTTYGGGASRLDIIPVFRSCLEQAEKESWDLIEISYIIKMLCSFSKWSIGITNTDYINCLLFNLHNFYKSIPAKFFKAYLKICPNQRKRDTVMIWAIRSPFYKIFSDYRTRNFWTRIADILRRILRRR